MPRNLFRDPMTGDVFEYDDDQVGLVREGLVPLTADEADAHLSRSTPSAAALRIAELLAKLESIDTQSARPLRAIVAGTATDDDRARLAELESMATAIRAELIQIQG